MPLTQLGWAVLHRSKNPGNEEIGSLCEELWANHKAEHQYPHVQNEGLKQTRKFFPTFIGI